MGLVRVERGRGHGLPPGIADADLGAVDDRTTVRIRWGDGGGGQRAGRIEVVAGGDLEAALRPPAVGGGVGLEDQLGRRLEAAVAAIVEQLDDAFEAVAAAGLLQDAHDDARVFLTGQGSVGPGAGSLEGEARAELAAAELGRVELGHLAGEVAAVGGGDLPPAAGREIQLEGVGDGAIGPDPGMGLALAQAGAVLEPAGAGAGRMRRPGADPQVGLVHGARAGADDLGRDAAAELTAEAVDVAQDSPRVVEPGLGGQVARAGIGAGHQRAVGLTRAAGLVREALLCCMALVHRGGLVAVAFLQGSWQRRFRCCWKQLLQRDLVAALQSNGTVLELEQGLRVDGELLAQRAAFQDRVQLLRRAGLRVGGEHQAGRGEGGDRRAQSGPDPGEAHGRVALVVSRAVKILAPAAGCPAAAGSDRGGRRGRGRGAGRRRAR